MLGIIVFRVDLFVLLFFLAQNFLVQVLFHCLARVLLGGVCAQGKCSEGGVVDQEVSEALVLLGVVQLGEQIEKVPH